MASSSSTRWMTRLSPMFLLRPRPHLRRSSAPRRVGGGGGPMGGLHRTVSLLKLWGLRSSRTSPSDIFARSVKAFRPRPPGAEAAGAASRPDPVIAPNRPARRVERRRDRLHEAGRLSRPARLRRYWLGVTPACFLKALLNEDFELNPESNITPVRLTRAAGATSRAWARSTR